MRSPSILVAALGGAAVLLSACASDPRTAPLVNQSGMQSDTPNVSAFRPIEPTILQADDFLKGKDPVLKRGSLAGREIAVGSIADIKLRDKEVVLTFDDGPVPGKTQTILDALAKTGAKATFLMVGQMAQSYPQLARKVAEAGHSVGSHTFSHKNLSQISYDAAVEEIRKGENALRKAGVRDIAFFRFPYLADTSALRSHLASRGVTVLDVQVDSKDYFKVSPGSIVERTMVQLETKGRGIILMHDIHQRTANMLPTLLNRLQSAGYKVVHLKPARGSQDPAS